MLPNPLYSDGGQYHPGYVLLDPYSTKSAPVVLSETYFNTAPHLPPYLNMEKPVWMGLLASLTEAPFDWQGAQHPLRTSSRSSISSVDPDDMVLIDIDINTFTQV